MEADQLNFPPDTGGRAAAGGRQGLRKKIQKLFGGGRAQPGPNTASATDGHHSSGDEEPNNGQLPEETSVNR